MRLLAETGTHGHMAIDSLFTRAAGVLRVRCGRGGIGRRVGFRSRSPLGVEVRVLSPALSPALACAGIQPGTRQT